MQAGYDATDIAAAITLQPAHGRHAPSHIYYRPTRPGYCRCAGQGGLHAEAIFDGAKPPRAPGSIDALRGVAAIGVALDHTNATPGLIAAKTNRNQQVNVLLQQAAIDPGRGVGVIEHDADRGDAAQGVDRDQARGKATLRQRIASACRAGPSRGV